MMNENEEQYTKAIRDAYILYLSGAVEFEVDVGRVERGTGLAGKGEDAGCSDGRGFTRYCAIQQVRR